MDFGRNPFNFSGHFKSDEKFDKLVEIMSQSLQLFRAFQEIETI